MTTTDTVAPDATTRRVRVGVFLIVVVLVLVPLAVTLISLLGTHWYPASDHALEVLRIRDVGGRHTPLTGAQSRFGWDHPGPWLFWGLAPFFWIAGATGVLYGVGVYNGLALVGAFIVARRRGGIDFVVILAVAVLVLCRGLTESLLIDVWNPWVGVLPFLLWMLLGWSVAERDYAALPWLVGVGSFLVQTHVGYAPLVLGVGAIVAILALAGPHAAEVPKTRWTLRKSAIATAIVGALLWLPPLVQQVTGHPGNLGEIVRYFRHPGEPPLGFAAAWGVMGKELPFAWITGHDLSLIGSVGNASAIPAVIFLTVVAVMAALAYRRGAYGAARLATLALAGSGVGVVATARITGLPGDYLVRWWWVIGALLWCSLAWSVLEVIRSASLERVLVPVGVGVVAVLSIWIAYMAVPAHVPLEPVSVALAHLRPQVESHLRAKQRYLVTWADSRGLGGSGNGLYLALDQDGYAVKVSSDNAHGFGSWRTATAGDIDATLTVVANDDADGGYAPPPGAIPIAHFDPLTSAQRARTQQLEQDIRSALRPDITWQPFLPDTPFGELLLTDGGADAAAVKELHRLRRAGSAYTVYLNDSTGATAS